MNRYQAYPRDITFTLALWLLALLCVDPLAASPTKVFLLGGKFGQNESSASTSESVTTPAHAVTIANTFSFKGDLALDGAYTSNPGNDEKQGDLYGADNPITIPVKGFTAAGSDKLVAVLSVHNSAAAVAPITSVTYGGAELFDKMVTGVNKGSSKNFIFYLDKVTKDGDLMIRFDDSKYNIDEVGLVLFALNGTKDGSAYTFETKVTEEKIATVGLTPVNANAGDFIVGVSQRNNGEGTIAVTNKPQYSEIDLSSGNLTARTGHQVASVSGNTAPAFSRITNAQFESVAAFAAAGSSETSAYDGWAAINAPTTGDNPLADEDQDGLANIIEFVVGGTRSSKDLNKLQAVSKDGSNMTFSFPRAQQSIDTSLAVFIEVGTDDITWPDVYPVPHNAITGSPVSVIKDSSPGYDTVTLSVPMAPDDQKFVRLKVAVKP